MSIACTDRTTITTGGSTLHRTRTRTRTLYSGLVIGLITLTVATATASAAPAPRTERITLSSTGEQIRSATGVSGVSGDGRYAVFVTDDDQVVPGDTNGTGDGFLRRLK